MPKANDNKKKQTLEVLDGELTRTFELLRKTLENLPHAIEQAVRKGMLEGLQDSSSHVSAEKRKERQPPKVPHCANEKRDAEILAMRQQIPQPTFQEVADYINKKYPEEFLSENSATAALIAYCKRHNVPYPVSRRGRKPDR